MTTCKDAVVLSTDEHPFFSKYKKGKYLVLSYGFSDLGRSEDEMFVHSASIIESSEELNKLKERILNCRKTATEYVQKDPVLFPVTFEELNVVKYAAKNYTLAWSCIAIELSNKKLIDAVLLKHDDHHHVYNELHNFQMNWRPHWCGGESCSESNCPHATM